MKKITNSLLMLVAFMLLGVGKASALTDLTIPSGPVTLVQDIYALKPASDGILTINFDRSIGAWDILGTSYSGKTVENPLEPLEKGTTFKWEVVGGTTYYLEGHTITSAKDPLTINSIELESAGTSYPQQMYYKIQSANMNWSTTGGSAFQSLGKGAYSQVFSVPANTYLRFYGDNTWYGPSNDVNITFTTNVYNGTIVANGQGFKFSEATAVAVELDLSKGTVKMTKVDMPEVGFILPGFQGAEVLTGIQLMWGYYLNLSACNPDNLISVKVPGHDTPFTYKWRILENVPGEEMGGTGTGSPYPNGLNLQNFMYAIGCYWQRQGNYEITVPANTVYITLENGYKMPNPETTVTYYCAGSGGYFDDEYVTMLYPTSNVVETLNSVQVRFPTTLNSEGFSSQLFSATGTVPVQVSIDGGEPVTLQGTISTDPRSPNRVTIDMSQFNSKPGVYTISFAEGVVYEDALPYMDGKKNRAVSFTIYVGMDDPESVYLQFTGVTNSYQLAQISEHSGLMYTPEAPTVNYPIDINDDAYVTVWAPIEYDLEIIAPSDLIYGTDYDVYYETATDYNTDLEVNAAQITFYTEQCYMQTFKIQIGEEGTSLPVSSLLPEADPADESTIANEFPMYMTVNWENKNIQLNPDCTATVSVLVDGKENDQAGIWNAVPVVWSNEWQTWEAAEEGQASSTLGLQIYTPYLETGSARITVNIPEGLVIIDGTEVNAAARFDYDLIALVENLETTPRKGSQVFELSTVDLTWVGFRLSKNQECRENVVYGKSNMFGDLEGDSTPVKSVTVNDNGSVTIDLGTTLEEAGQYAISIPEGYFLVTSGSAQLPNPNPISLTYTIANYRTLPGNYENVLGELASFAVLGKKSIEFTGDVANVEVSLWGEPVDATVKAANQTTIDGSPAIEFVLSEPLTDPEMYTITVPAGSLTIDGVAYNENIEWIVSVVEGAVADPEDGSELETLETVNVNWSGSALTFGEGSVILSNGTQTFDVTENAKITTYEVDYGWDVGTAYQLTIDFTDVAYTAGEYTLTIPAGFVYIDQYRMYNEEVVLHYTVLNDAPDDAVGSIEVETEGEAVYYNLNGQRVVNPERGIYIKVVNGKATKIVK